MIATEVIKEALREYVGDGDGADEEVLAQHDEAVAEAATRKARRGGWRLLIVMWVVIVLNLVSVLLNGATWVVRIY